MKDAQLYLYGWVFTFNDYDKLWYAAPRGQYADLFNNKKAAGILSNADFDSLIEIIKAL